MTQEKRAISAAGTWGRGCDVWPAMNLSWRCLRLSEIERTAMVKLCRRGDRAAKWRISARSLLTSERYIGSISEARGAHRGREHGMDCKVGQEEYRDQSRVDGGGISVVAAR